jgi:hypothetical protein
MVDLVPASIICVPASVMLIHDGRLLISLPTIGRTWLILLGYANWAWRTQDAPQGGMFNEELVDGTDTGQNHVGHLL